MATIDAPFPRLALFAALFAMCCVASASPAIPSSATRLTSCEARAIRHAEVMIAAQMVNWEPVDARSVLIWMGRSRQAHLVHLAKPLPGIREAPIITLLDGDGDGTISPCGKDIVVLGEEDGRVSDGAPRAAIVSVQLLSTKRTAQLDRGAQLPPLASART